MYGGDIILYICIMYIDFLKEHELIQGLLKRLPRVDPHDTVVLNVSPDYSSTVSMHIAHHLSEEGTMLDIVSVDVPYPGEERDYYELKFKIKERLLDRGYENDDIITVALTEMNSSKFKCDYVQAYTDTMPEFYWERYNKHWE